MPAAPHCGRIWTVGSSLVARRVFARLRFRGAPPEDHGENSPRSRSSRLLLVLALPARFYLGFLPLDQRGCAAPPLRAPRLTVGVRATRALERRPSARSRRRRRRSSGSSTRTALSGRSQLSARAPDHEGAGSARAVVACAARCRHEDLSWRTAATRRPLRRPVLSPRRASRHQR